MYIYTYTHICIFLYLPSSLRYVPPGARGSGAAAGVVTGGGTSLAALAAAVDGSGSTVMRTGPVLGAGLHVHMCTYVCLPIYVSS